VVSPAKSNVVGFGVYEFNVVTGELRRDGMRMRLEGQPLTILQMLLERPGELVTREELQKRLWPGETFVDFEHSLNAAVKRLRAALSDSAEQPLYIETQARRGYRFIAPLDGVVASAEAVAFAPPANGNNAISPDPPAHQYTSLAASADGRRLVATRATPNRTLWHLRIADSPAAISETDRIPLTTNTGFSPRLGPNYLLYVSAIGTGESIWKLVNGTNTELWRGEGARVFGGPAISPNGQSVAFSVRQNGQTVLYVMQADGTNARIVTDSLDLQGDPAWAPDGQSNHVGGRRSRHPPPLSRSDRRPLSCSFCSGILGRSRVGA
jgi:DNA-binding winged helix-turn-helix (wHTH) protein